jgi:hypothetical protein
MEAATNAYEAIRTASRPKPIAALLWQWWPEPEAALVSASHLID